MKNKALQSFPFLSFILLFSSIVHAQNAEIPFANWTAQHLTKEEFFDCRNFEGIQILQPWGEVVTSLDPNHVLSFLQDAFPNAPVTYYSLDYKTAKKPDTKHEIVKAQRALSIRSFIHVRDYEANEVGGNPNYGTLNVDTVHVLAVPSSKITEEILNKYQIKIDPVLETTKASTVKGFYHPNLASWRNSVLHLFKSLTDVETHKLVKGPYYDSQKNAEKMEEEWGAQASAGSQFVCYADGGCAFYDLSNLTSQDQFVYVLFYAGDGTSNVNGLGYKTMGEQDDLMGIVKVPVSAIQNVESHLMYLQFENHTDKAHTLDFAVEFGTVNTSAQ